jgi:hypothetical protein
VEIAKLSLWLKCARKAEKVVDLSTNLVAADSLEVDGVFERLGVGPGQFDLVIGNPPWGGEVEPATREHATRALGIEDAPRRDTWELFLLLALKALREGGRLALLLPDSFFYPEKARTRAALFALAQVEKVYHLGVDWFGSKVRMGTVFVQARRGPVDPQGGMLGLVLAGDLRREAIRGRVTLSQIEAGLRRELPVARTLANPSHEVEVFRGSEDDRIIRCMTDRSIRLADLCERTRGEEINKAGLVWECPSCQLLNTPGTKRKGGGYDPTTCERCGHPLTESSVRTMALVQSERPPGEDSVPFIDGDDLRERYERVTPNKWLRSLPGWPHYKPARQYRAPKILFRKTGVGVSATLDRTTSRCPQSVFLFRLKEECARVGYTHEYVLGALLSRSMAYVLLKRFAEPDPAKAFVYLTYARLADLPIPRVDFGNREQTRIHAAISAAVRRMLRSPSPSGGSDDWEVELGLRSLWGLSASDGEHINGEFAYIPQSQAVRALFPDGPPQPVPSDVDGADE